jgi:hypothetical protein
MRYFYITVYHDNWEDIEINDSRDSYCRTHIRSDVLEYDRFPSYKEVIKDMTTNKYDGIQILAISEIPEELVKSYKLGVY